MSGHVRDELGGFVLGALEADEAERVRAHLAGCSRCRGQHEQLVGLPALLDLLPADARRATPSPPTGMEDAVLAGLAAQRGGSDDPTDHVEPVRRRWARRQPVLVLGSALAGAAATLAGLAAGGTLGGSDPRASTIRLSAPDSVARATAVLRPQRGGTQVALRVEGLTPTLDSETYEVWFVRPEGRVSAGTFTVGADAEADVDLMTAAQPGGYSRIGVTREPDGLDPARNGPNVLAGRLPG